MNKFGTCHITGCNTIIEPKRTRYCSKHSKVFAYPMCQVCFSQATYKNTLTGENDRCGHHKKRGYVPDYNLNTIKRYINLKHYFMVLVENKTNATCRLFTGNSIIMDRGNVRFLVQFIANEDTPLILEKFGIHVVVIRATSSINDKETMVKFAEMASTIILDPTMH